MICLKFWYLVACPAETLSTSRYHGSFMVVLEELQLLSCQFVISYGISIYRLVNSGRTATIIQLREQQILAVSNFPVVLAT